MPNPGAAQPNDTTGIDAQGWDWARIRRIVAHAAVSAWVLSLVIHVMLLIIAAIITYQPSQAGGAGGAGEYDVEMAIVTEAELIEIQQSALATGTPGVPDMPAPDLPSLDVLVSDLTSEIAGLTDISDMSVVIGGGDVSGGALGVAGAGGGSASFFGVEARGKRFAYIVDISGSMTVEGRIETLRDQLISSINALNEVASFYVVAFNHGAWPLTDEIKWLRATVAGKRDATALIERVEASGGTVPLPAFQKIYTLKPRPDAIYFMTDGEFDPLHAEEIASMNKDHKIPIHCIAYMSSASEPVMQKIARDSGGTYTYVPGGKP